MTVNLEYYKIFYYVGKKKSITLAAEELSVSQPAVSQAMKQLEQAVGAQLLIRTSKGIQLTTEGRILYAHVEKGYEQIEHGEKLLRQMLNLETGEIRIGASDMTLQFFLLPFLEQFHEKYPKIKVNVTNAPTPETLKYLQEGKIDFGVVSTPIESKYDFEITKVREIEDIFVAGMKFFQLRNHNLDYKELENLPIIYLEKNTSTRKYMDAFLMENQVVLSPEFELATSDMIVQFALRNLGIGCVMKDFAQKYLETGELFELMFNRKMPKRHFCIATDQKNPVSTAAGNLLKLIFA